ncbi:MAG: hypothetical protein ACRC4L_01955 [Mycoplasma sp.]
MNKNKKLSKIENEFDTEKELWEPREYLQDKNSYSVQDSVIENRFDFGNEASTIIKSVKPYSKNKLRKLLDFRSED